MKESPSDVDSGDVKSSQQPATDRSIFARVWALGLTALVAVTYPLWLRWSTNAANFPRVTWFGLPASDPIVFVLDQVAIAMLLIGAATQVFLGFHRWCWWLIGGALLFLILTDQARLQPWAYQSALYAFILVAIRWNEARRWITAVAISIYLYSALGKLDYQFAHTVGSEMIRTFFSPFGQFDDQISAKLALLLPLSELSIACLLIIRRTRKAGGVLAIVMHILLVVLLGPFILRHSLGVLAWNILLATQAWFLFLREAATDESERNATASLAWVARVITSSALLMPLVERSGYWDHWTSWALYSPHNSRVEIQVHDSALNRLPESLRRYANQDDDSNRWQDLDIETWSFENRLVPVYPQARFQLAFGVELARRFDLGQAIRAKTKSVSNRMDGTRVESFLLGQPELEDAMKQYWLRSRP